MKNINQSILTPIVFFDLFDYPVTTSEVVRYAAGVVEYDQATRALEQLAREKKIEGGNGFWFLPGRAALIETRNRRHALAYRKWRRALRVIGWLRHFPFVRFIGVANTLAYDNADDASDIDLFFITKKNRAWTARFFVTLFLVLLRLRPRPGYKRDKICCCFWVDETALDISSTAIENDIYLWYWIATLWPAGNFFSQYEKFWDANRALLNDLPNVRPIVPNQFRRVESSGTSQTFFERLATLIPEHWLRSVQKKKFPHDIRQQMNDNSNVVVNDHVLKFHVRDMRTMYRDAWRKKINETLS